MTSEDYQYKIDSITEANTLLGKQILTIIQESAKADRLLSRTYLLLSGPHGPEQLNKLRDDIAMELGISQTEPETESAAESTV